MPNALRIELLVAQRVTAAIAKQLLLPGCPLTLALNYVGMKCGARRQRSKAPQASYVSVCSPVDPPGLEADFQF